MWWCCDWFRPVVYQIFDVQWLQGYGHWKKETLKRGDLNTPSIRTPPPKCKCTKTSLAGMEKTAAYWQHWSTLTAVFISHFGKIYSYLLTQNREIGIKYRKELGIINLQLHVVTAKSLLAGYVTLCYQ